MFENAEDEPFTHVFIDTSEEDSSPGVEEEPTSDLTDADGDRFLPIKQ